MKVRSSRRKPREPLEWRVGVLLPNGRVDVERTRELVALAKPMKVTFHRAFDETPDMAGALEDVIRCGVDCFLTSGGEPDVLAGAESIAKLRKLARGRLDVMAGGGLQLASLVEVLRRTGVSHLHGSLSRRLADHSDGGLQHKRAILCAPAPWYSRQTCTRQFACCIESSRLGNLGRRLRNKNEAILFIQRSGGNSGVIRSCDPFDGLYPNHTNALTFERGNRLDGSARISNQYMDISGRADECGADIAKFAGIGRDITCLACLSILR